MLCTFKTSLTTCERFYFDHGPWILNNVWIHDKILEPERKLHLIKLPNGAGGREKVSLNHQILFFVNKCYWLNFAV